MTNNNQIEFYKYLNGETSIQDFEQFVYNHPELEAQMDAETYIDLIGFNYKDLKSERKLKKLILDKIVEEGNYEKWKLIELLSSFLVDIKNTHKYLDKFYYLYCGIYQDDEPRKYEFKFLRNLGLNSFHWMEEGYLKTHYGGNWKIEYQKCLNELDFYHAQLKPFAEEILQALNNNNILINSEGSYTIKAELKLKLETDDIYKLKHIEENNN